MKNLDLFPQHLAAAAGEKPRQSPRHLMHVADAGHREDGQPICKMHCRRCGAETGWLPFRSVTAAKRGIPCEACNKPAPGGQ